jgi:hypothetical protein
LKSCLEEKVAAPVQKTEITAAGIHHTDLATLLYPLKLALTSPTSGGRSAGIVRSRAKATELLVIDSIIAPRDSDFLVSGANWHPIVHSNCLIDMDIGTSIRPAVSL